MSGGDLRGLGNNRREAPLGPDGAGAEDGVQREHRTGVVWRALDPAAEPIDRASYQRQGRVARRDLGIEETAITAGAAVRRELQIVMEDLFEAAVGIRFPDGAAPTLRAFVKYRLAPNR